MNNTEIWTLVVSLFLYILATIVYILYANLRKENLGKTAGGISTLGFFVHTLSLIIRTKISGHLPLSNMYESMSFFAWAIVLIYLIILIKTKFKILGSFIMPLAVIIIGYTLTLSKEISPLVPALRSYWLVFHVITCMLAYAAFAISFATSIMYLVYSKKTINNKESVIDSNYIDDFSYKNVAIGFSFLTLGIITGSIWANSAWGTYWSWDPKETWALITWMVYAIYLHLRFRKKWKGTKSAILSIIGFCIVIFTYIGVNFLLSGLHSYG